MIARAKIAAFTSRGVDTALSIASAIGSCDVYAPRKFARGGALEMESLASWTRDHFGSSDALIFVSAAGIAVRAIAPHLRGKDVDPAVVAVDERGTFAISLLSGHIGGANELARTVARAIGATAVVTTATDSGGAFSVDDFARRNALAVTDLGAAKAIASAVLEGRPVGIISDIPIADAPPEGVVVGSASRGMELGAVITSDEDARPFGTTLRLAPAPYFVGIGTRRGRTVDEIAPFFEETIALLGVRPEEIASVASIDVKRGERGIIELCERYRIRYITFSAEELNELVGDFTRSSFVSDTVGVDCVCERAAVRASRGGSLILRKTARCGVTIAVARAERTEEIRFG